MKTIYELKGEKTTKKGTITIMATNFKTQDAAEKTAKLQKLSNIQITPIEVDDVYIISQQPNEWLEKFGDYKLF